MLFFNMIFIWKEKSSTSYKITSVELFVFFIFYFVVTNTQYIFEWQSSTCRRRHECRLIYRVTKGHFPIFLDQIPQGLKFNFMLFSACSTTYVLMGKRTFIANAFDHSFQRYELLFCRMGSYLSSIHVNFVFIII